MNRLDLDPLDRVPPCDAKAEASVVGAILLDNAAASVAVAAGLQAEHFYRSATRDVFAAAVKLMNDDQPIDETTLAAALERAGVLERVGGYPALAEFVEVVPSAANVAHYVGIVREKHALRTLAKIGRELAGEAETSSDTAAVVLDRCERRLMDAIAARAEKTAFRLVDLLHEELDRIESDKRVPALPSHLRDLDEVTGGFKAGELTILAARPSMGKSSLAFQVAAHNAIRGDIPTVLFSQEMGRQNVVQNVLGQEAMISAFRMRACRLTAEEKRAIGRRAGEIAEAPLIVDDASGLTVSQLRAKGRLHKLRDKLGLVIVDFLQLMAGSGEENRNQEVGAICRGAKDLAKELRVPLLMLAQVNRQNEQRADKRPTLADLRDSGEIEQAADMVLFIHREGYYKPTDPTVQSKAEVIVAKNRNGPTGVVPVVWNREVGRFDGAGRA